MDINQFIDNRIREVVAEMIGDVTPAEPEMITLDEACRIMGCSRSTADALHRDRATNGFPSVMLGPRTINVDKRRLHTWITSGGLGVKV